MLIVTNTIVANKKDNSPVIARVGEDSITVNQFIGLFELNPRINNSNSTSLTASRIDFLHTLIGNKLWYQYRHKNGMDTTFAERTAQGELKTMFTLDRLYRSKILDMAEPTDAQVNSAITKAFQTLVVKSIYSESESEINNLYLLLEHGFEFNEILSTIDENKSEQFSHEINFGDYDKTVEDELYNLEVGKYSNPIKLEDGYYIFNLANVITKHFADEQSYSQEVLRVKDILRKREEDRLYDNFMRSVLNGNKITFDKTLRDNLITQIDLLKQRRSLNNNANESIFVLLPSDIIEIEEALGSNLIQNTLINIDTINISLQKYFRSLIFNHPKVKFDAGSCRDFIERNILDYARTQMLYIEAMKLKIDKEKAVEDDLKNWVEYFSFEAVRGALADTISITDDMILEVSRKYFQGSPDSLSENKLNQVELIKNKLIDQKVSSLLKQATADLSENISIKINYVLLQGLEATNINSFALRKLGFGGSILAAPIYFPNSDWVNPNNYKQYILP